MTIQTSFRRVATGLTLAASPTFAAMAALVTFMPGSASLVCGGNDDLWGLTGGMAWMYGLMSLFHLPAWIKVANASRQICHSQGATSDS